MKKILLFGAGKSATVLIDYLTREAPANNWIIMIADANKEQLLAKINPSTLVEAIQTDITNDQQRSGLIQQASIVISMMPPNLHFLIAKDCVAYGINLLTASYIDAAIKSLEPEIQQKKLLFIGEMGLDPGIDHMSAMKLIAEIKAKGGTITSFKSHCGGLVAPEADDNPWHYKISWNPRNVVLAGISGADYKLNNKLLHKEYKSLFNDCEEVELSGIGQLAFYPNRDSLGYIPLYQLEDAHTFLRTTLRYPAYCKGWNAIVQAGLTDEAIIAGTDGLTFEKWSTPVLPFVTPENKPLLDFLGLFDKNAVPATANTSAAILQFLLETKLGMRPGDKDMIVMLHQVTALINDAATSIESSLVVKGEDHIRTAMAKTVGLPLGIAAKLILNGTIKLTGVHIPTIPEIYLPVLHELAKEGIVFEETSQQE